MGRQANAKWAKRRADLRRRPKSVSEEMERDRRAVLFRGHRKFHANGR